MWGLSEISNHGGGGKALIVGPCLCGLVRVTRETLLFGARGQKLVARLLLLCPELR